MTSARVQEHAMPPKAPLEMRVQDFRKAPRPRPAETKASASYPWRIALFAPALLGTAALLYGIYGWLSGGGMSGLEWLLLGLIGATFVWVTLSVATVCLGLAGQLTRPLRTERRETSGSAVALLMPIYNEVPADVFGNAAAMLDDIAARGGPHRYTLFILSDSRDEEIAAQEWQAFQRLSQTAPLPVFYRRRSANTDKKVGNLMDWITGWGADYPAMVVLDADSLMTGRAIDRLADALADDPDAGLVQSFPMLIGAETVFARLQQFSNIAYGWLLAEGLAQWSRGEGNYWGHNAIIRTRAFAESAGLPRLKRWGARDLILSHDFVEAGLMRRAGWRVRFLPRITGSFEETPATLIDHVLRDRRWCRGNLQHLRLLLTRGLHPVSRFHLLQGAMSYLLSPAWFALLLFWALLGRDEETNVIRYFNEANPMFPDWPPAMSHIDSAIFLLIMYGMLLAPKIMAAGLIAASPPAARLFGGRRAFGTAFIIEALLSVAYAPVMMIQQTKAVFRCCVTRSEPWAPQSRSAKRYPFATLLRFHWLETIIGLILAIGLTTGLLSWWLLPITASLVCAVPLSCLSAMNVAGVGPRAWTLQSPYTLREPAIFRSALRARRTTLQHLQTL
ncbi:MAG: glucans biosynthesis glucosyltransferase MdoH [Pseudomonadota bacterium]